MKVKPFSLTPALSGSERKNLLKKYCQDNTSTYYMKPSIIDIKFPSDMLRNMLQEFNVPVFFRTTQMGLGYRLEEILHNMNIKLLIIEGPQKIESPKLGLLVFDNLKELNKRLEFIYEYVENSDFPSRIA